MTGRIPLVAAGAFLCAHQTPTFVACSDSHSADSKLAALQKQRAALQKQGSNRFSVFETADDDEPVITEASTLSRQQSGKNVLLAGLQQEVQKHEESVKETAASKKKRAKRASQLLVAAMAHPNASNLLEQVEELVPSDDKNLHLQLSAMCLPEEQEAEERAAAEEQLRQMQTPQEEDLACARAAPAIMADTDTFMGHFRAPVELPAELAVIAERELGETPEVRTQALKEFRQRLETLEREGVPSSGYLWREASTAPIAFARKDDQFLICFLRARKFRLDDAERLIINYTNFVHKHAEILTSLDSRDPFLDPAFMGKHIGVYQLPGTTRAGGRVIAVRMKEMNKSMFDNLTVEEHRDDYFKLMIRQMIHIYTKQLSDPWFQVKGVFFYQDFEDGPSLAQIYQSDLLSLRQKKDMLGLLHDTIPMRFNGVVLMNQPVYISVFLNLLKPFMNKKLRERIYLLGDDVSQLHALVDPKQLPKEWGREFKGELDYAPMREKLAEYYPKWAIHACNWEELGISASHVENHVAAGLDEHAPPPYDGSKKIKDWVASRRAGPENEEATVVKSRKASAAVLRAARRKGTQKLGLQTSEELKASAKAGQKKVLGSKKLGALF